MPQKSWSAKRKREFLHVKEGLLAPGEPELAPVPEPVVSRPLSELLDEARQRGIKGRSTMNKAELEAALTR